MTRRIPHATLAAFLGATLSLLAQPPANAKIEIKGQIESVSIKPGGGMPSMGVKTPDGRLWTVRLGSIRYLIANGFDMKAGQEVNVRGIKLDAAELLAISLESVKPRQKIALRDEDGMPLWRGQGMKYGPPK